MEDYPKTPYSIIIEGCNYLVHEQEKNMFLVTHETRYSDVISIVETAIFILSPAKVWRLEGRTNINKGHWHKIFTAIESRIV